LAKKRDLAGAACVEGAHLPDPTSGVAGDAAAEARGDLAERQRPRRAFVTSPAACRRAP
jgi:hypothetical protein